MTARGLRNNNPGNLRDTSIKWDGLVGHDDLGFCVFVDAYHGLRALGIDLLTKFRRGLDTVRKIIEVYAPPNENNTEAYITNLCVALAVKDDQKLELATNLGQLATLERAIVRHENGSIPYQVTEIIKAASAAMAFKHPG